MASTKRMMPDLANLREFCLAIKNFLWAWLDKYRDEDVRIALQVVPYWGNPALLLELEAIILRATEPPYNAQIPPER